MSDDKSLIELEKQHTVLVENLKKALLFGQESFIRCGAILSEIKSKQTYLSEDAAHQWTWEDFIARPDLPFPGRTPQSRRRVADALIRVFKVFKEKFNLDTEELASIGWTKLDLLAPVVDKLEKKEDVNDWLDKARDLTVPDLAMEISGKEPEIGANLTCKHENAYQIWYCPDCNARSKNDLRKHGTQGV